MLILPMLLPPPRSPRHTVRDFCTVTVKQHGRTTCYDCEKNIDLLTFLQRTGHLVVAPCGGNGKCGKCVVNVTSGECAVTGSGKVRACRSIVKEDITVDLDEAEGKGIEKFFSGISTDKTGIAVDVGTTTIAAAYCDGKNIRYASCLNSQSVFGSDVISRIRACSDVRNLEKMRDAVTNDINGLIRSLTGCDSAVENGVIAANTTMLHILCGVSPVSMGVAPFKPTFLDAKIVTDSNLLIKKATLVCGISAYVGADVAAGLVATDMLGDSGVKVLMDIGTNGEVVVNNNGVLWCASTAAGPAFEGACSCGMGGVDGAISRIGFDGRLNIQTINGTAAKGLCGSGLTDAIALLIENGGIDESGAFCNGKRPFLEKSDFNDRAYITCDVYVSQKDIRQFQLAKSALCSGVTVLLKKAGASLDDVDRLYIAGGLGYYTDISNASIAGVIPRQLKDKAIAVGNSSLQGAIRILDDRSLLDVLKEKTSKCNVVELSDDADFAETYIENLSF